MKMLIVVAAFLVAIGILVAVHEFGHYWVAKKLGFKVLRFSIGFGKPLWTRVGAAPDHTEYCIAAIPLGGYVKLLDEREGDVSAAELPRSFTRRPIAHRIAVLFAGPAMNFLFAALLYALLAMGGTEIAKPVVGDVRPGSPAALAGLARGDTIVQVGDRRIDDLEALQIALIERFTEDGTIPLRVTHDGSERAMTLTVKDDRRTLTEPGKLLPGLGFDLASWRASTTVQSVPADSAGAKAGLRAGDRLLAVDGHEVGNSPEFIAAVSASPGRDVAIDLQRGDEHLRVIAAVPAVVNQGRTIGRLGITLQEGVRTWPPGVIQMRRSGPIDAVVGGLVKTWDMSALTVQMLWRVAAGQVSTKNISGPISIAEFAGDSASLGIGAFMAFLAIISVSLGVLNLAPVPLLDGGQIVYQLIEGIKGSPLSERAQLFGQQVGIAMLMVLMSLAFYNDISRHLN
jgi:regulator of sigma E protease